MARPLYSLVLYYNLDLITYGKVRLTPMLIYLLFY